MPSWLAWLLKSTKLKGAPATFEPASLEVPITGNN